MMMEIIIAIGVTVVAALAFIFRRRPRVRHATVDYLIPSKEDQPLTPREVFVAGINHVGMCGEHRQELIAKLRRGEPIHLIRLPDHPNDQNAGRPVPSRREGHRLPAARDNAIGLDTEQLTIDVISLRSWRAG
jgi:hypothetical protein